MPGDDGVSFTAEHASSSSSRGRHASSAMAFSAEAGEASSFSAEAVDHTSFGDSATRSSSSSGGPRSSCRCTTSSAEQKFFGGEDLAAEQPDLYSGTSCSSSSEFPTAQPCTRPCFGGFHGYDSSKCLLAHGVTDAVAGGVDEHRQRRRHRTGWSSSSSAWRRMHSHHHDVGAREESLTCDWFVGGDDDSPGVFVPSFCRSSAEGFWLAIQYLLQLIFCVIAKRRDDTTKQRDGMRRQRSQQQQRASLEQPTRDDTSCAQSSSASCHPSNKNLPQIKIATEKNIDLLATEGYLQQHSSSSKMNMVGAGEEHCHRGDASAQVVEEDDVAPNNGVIAAARQDSRSVLANDVTSSSTASSSEEASVVAETHEVQHRKVHPRGGPGSDVPQPVLAEVRKQHSVSKNNNLTLLSRNGMGIARQMKAILFAIFCALVSFQIADAFILVSNQGHITLLGPVDIDPSINDASIKFKKDGAVQWQIKSTNLYTPAMTNTQDLVFASSNEPSGMVAFTPDGRAVFNTTLSVLHSVEFGSSLSVYDMVSLGSLLSVKDVTYLGSTLSVSGAVRLGYEFSVFMQANFGSSVTVLDWFSLGSSMSVNQFVRFGSTLSLRSFARLGDYLSVRSYQRLGSSLSVWGTVRFGSSYSVMDFVVMASSLSVSSFSRLGKENE